MTIRERMWKQISFITFFTMMLVFVVVPSMETAQATVNTQPEYKGIAIEGVVKQNRRSADFDLMMEQAIKDGALLIQCYNNKCYDTATSQFFGEGQDGYYLLYKNTNQVNSKELKRLSEEIKKLGEEVTNISLRQ